MSVRRLCDQPNMHARPAGIELGARFAVLHGYQEFQLTKDSVEVLPADQTLQRKQRLLAELFAPKHMARRSVLDLGANAGFYSFWALQNGATEAVCVDIDEVYLDLIADAAEHVGFSSLKTELCSVSDWERPGDVVVALALVHWLFSCTATFGSLASIISKLASLTNYLLVVEWIDPTDEAIRFFGHLEWNSDCIKEAYTESAFLTALSEHFARVQLIGNVSPTRRLYAAFRNFHEIDLSAPLEMLRDKDTVISSRWLGSKDGADYWSRVYDCAPECHILKQTTHDLAAHEYSVLSRLSGPCFPRAISVKHERDSSVVSMERIEGLPLSRAAAELRSDSGRIHAFVVDCLDLLGQLSASHVLHRDIRPEHIIVRDGRPVLIDFGWAEVDGEPFITPSGLGNEYSPPDGEFCDVYSLGKVIDELNQDRYPAISFVARLMRDDYASSRIRDVEVLKSILAIQLASPDTQPTSPPSQRDSTRDLSPIAIGGRPVVGLNLAPEIVHYISARERKITHLVAETQRLGAELAERDRTLADVRGQLAERDRTLADVRGQLAERDRTLADVQGQLAERDRTLADVRGQLAERDRALVDARGQVMEVSRLHDNLVQHYQRAAGDLRALQQTRTVRVSRFIGQALRRLDIQRKIASLSRAGISAVLDLPTADSAHSNSLRIAGWAFSSNSQIEQIEVLLGDGPAKLGTVSYGHFRPDVVAARPWQRDSRCGFSGSVSLDGVPPGNVSIVVRVTDQFGGRFDLRRVIRVTPDHEGRAIPTLDDGNNAALRDFGRLADLRLRSLLFGDRKISIPFSANPVVSIVIPVRNQAHLTLSVIESLLGADSTVEYEIVVVDDASSDSTTDLLARVQNIRAHYNDTNRGFGYSCNAGAQLARGKYLCFLNNDVLLTQGWLSCLVETMLGNPAYGAVGAKLIHPDGRLQEAGGIVWSDGSTAAYGRRGDPENPEFNYVREVDYCSAACLLVDRDVFAAIGGFDAIYAPAYYEDVDLCMAVRRARRLVAYQPSAVAIHLEFGSSNAERAIALQIRNRVRFEEKWRDELTGQHPNPGSRPITFRDRRVGKRVLFMDDRVPESELGSGFPRTRALLDSLADLGYPVTFLPICVSANSRVSRQLCQRGIEVIVDVDDPVGLLETRPDLYDIAIVSRPHNSHYIEPIKRLNPRVKVIYDAEAVYSLRDIGLARLRGELISADEESRLIGAEIGPMKSADLVVTVSELERQTIEHHCSGVETAVWGHALEVRNVPVDPGARRDILFVGYLASPPNIDALLHLLTKLLPPICDLTGCRLRVVGAGATTDLADVMAASRDRVEILGSVADLTDIYDRARVFVAPHRFAAGIPLKVLDAMANGVPCVISRLLADQLEVSHGVEALVADDEQGFIKSVADIYADADLWRRIQRNAAHFVSERYGYDVMREWLAEIVGSAGCKSLSAPHRSRHTNGHHPSVPASDVGLGTPQPPSENESADSPDNARTIAYWVERIEGSKQLRDQWQAHPVVREAIRQHFDGLELEDWLRERLPGKRAAHGIGLGVGRAKFEIELLRSGAVGRFDVYDLAPQLLTGASESAAELGVDDRLICRVADINQVLLPEDSCDLVTLVSSLHHFADLERVVNECFKALRPGGVFFASEYVGPNRFAFPEEHLCIARSFYRDIDPSLRCPWPELPVPDPAAVIAADPTEAIHSAEIIEAVQHVFANVQVVSLDVALTVMLWYGLNHDALYKTQQGHDLVSQILSVDRDLIGTGRLPSYHVIIIARKP